MASGLDEWAAPDSLERVIPRTGLPRAPGSWRLSHLYDQGSHLVSLRLLPQAPQMQEGTPACLRVGGACRSPGRVARGADMPQHPWSCGQCPRRVRLQSRGFGAASFCRQGGHGCPLSATLLLSSRPPDLGGPPPRKAVLSMNGLSFGVIRVDTEEKLSVLTVQDVGQVLPGGERGSWSVSGPAAGRGTRCHKCSRLRTSALQALKHKAS